MRHVCVASQIAELPVLSRDADRLIVYDGNEHEAETKLGEQRLEHAIEPAVPDKGDERPVELHVVFSRFRPVAGGRCPLQILDYRLEPLKLLGRCLQGSLRPCPFEEAT